MRCCVWFMFFNLFNSESRKQSKELKKLLRLNKIRISPIRSTIFSLRKKFQHILNPRSELLVLFPYKMSRSEYARQLRDVEIKALIDRKDLWILEQPRILYDDYDCF